MIRTSIVFMIATAFMLSAEAQPIRLLVFAKTAGFRHESIEPGVKAVTELARNSGFQIDATEDASVFNTTGLQRYDAVIFLNTTGDVLDRAQQTAFEQFIRGGKGFVGIHAAADTEYDWPWYGKLVGGYFDSHGAVQQASVHKALPFGANSQPDPWVRTDEWYNYKNLSATTKVIFKVDEKTFADGKHGADHPIAWYHDYDGGRAFYTGMGHRPEAFSEPLYLQHVLDGIRYAVGAK